MRTAAAAQSDPAFTISYLPPEYPACRHPGRCRHEPQFAIHADLRIDETVRRGSKIEIDFPVCLACGASRDGENLFVAYAALWARWGWQPKFGARIVDLRNKWGRIAEHLFGADGWSGRHETIARLIDPDLRMRLRIEQVMPDGTRIASISFAPEAQAA